MEVISTQRGGFCLIFEGQRYRVDRKYEDRCTWRCAGHRTCKARITTDCLPKPTTVLRDASQHSHETAQATLDTERVRTSLKEQLKDSLKRKAGDMTDSANDLACAEAEPFKSLSYDDIPKFRQIIKRIRLESRPPLPQSKPGVFQSLESYRVLDRKLNMIVTDKTDQIIMITAKDNLHYLAAATNVLGDGTFQFCEKHFYQLYVVHAYLRRIYTPCIYFLLPDKTTHI